MPSPKFSPLGPVWVRVVACFIGLCCFPITLGAVCIVKSGWIVFAALPSALMFVHSAHTLHTGSPPPVRQFVKGLIDAVARWRGKK